MKNKIDVSLETVHTHTHTHTSTLVDFGAKEEVESTEM